MIYEFFIHSYWLVRFEWTAPRPGSRDFGGTNFGERSGCDSLYRYSIVFVVEITSLVGILVRN